MNTPEAFLATVHSYCVGFRNDKQKRKVMHLYRFVMTTSFGGHTPALLSLNINDWMG